MSKDIQLSVCLSSEIEERLDRAVERIGAPQEMIVEFAVKEFLEDLDFEASAQAGDSLRGTVLSDRE